ncbi:MAG: DUF3592 domain-containing protein [Ruminococcus sp.]|nr:DUF3592 domain-containing protein [Candidatus Apopatosoma intestinale]
MSLLNVARKTAMIRAYVGLILVGLVFAGIGGFVISRPQGTYLPTEATVTKVISEYDTVTETYGGEIYVRYRVDGTEYSDVLLSGYTDGYAEGDKITVEYDADDPSSARLPGGKAFPYLFCALGVILTVVGIAGLCKSIRTKTSEMNEYNQVDLSAVPQEKIDAIRENTDPVNDYFFHFDKNFKQGYVMEDAEHRTVYEAKMEKLTLLGTIPFTFINHISGRSWDMKIGHTVSTSVGAGDGFSFRVPIRSSFTVNGTDNWKYLASKGYGFDYHLSGICPCFDVRHYGEKVAYVETTGTNTLRGTDNAIGKLPVNGLFKVQCKACDLDLVFLTCFSIARAVFYEN